MSDDGKSNAYISVDELVERIRKYHPEDDMELVRRAYALRRRRTPIRCANPAIPISAIRAPWR